MVDLMRKDDVSGRRAVRLVRSHLKNAAALSTHLHHELAKALSSWTGFGALLATKAAEEGTRATKVGVTAADLLAARNTANGSRQGWP